MNWFATGRSKRRGSKWEGREGRRSQKGKAELKKYRNLSAFHSISAVWWSSFTSDRTISCMHNNEEAQGPRLFCSISYEWCKVYWISICWLNCLNCLTPWLTIGDADGLPSSFANHCLNDLPNCFCLTGYTSEMANPTNDPSSSPKLRGCWNRHRPNHPRAKPSKRNSRKSEKGFSKPLPLVVLFLTRAFKWDKDVPSRPTAQTHASLAVFQDGSV